MSQSYPVIIQIGSKSITAGFAGDAIPTIRKRTSDYVQLDWRYDVLNTDLQLLEMSIEMVLYDIYTKYLLVDPKRCKSIVLENVLLPKPIKEVISKALLFHLHAQSVIFYPEPIMSCVGAGSHSGVVIDLGWNETVITPIYDLRMLYNLNKKSIRAGKSIHGLVRSETGFDDELAERFIAEVSYCQVQPSDKSEFDFFCFEGKEVKNYVRYKPYESLYAIADHDDDDNKSIIVLVKQLFTQLNIDLRGSLSDKIIITGGLSNVPGIKSRIMNELNELGLSAIKSLGPWEGTSLYCSTTLMSPSITQGKLNELNRDKYLTGEATLVDWIDQLYQN